MKMHRTTIVASITLASALAAGAVFGVADSTPDTVDLVVGFEQPPAVNVADGQDDASDDTVDTARQLVTASRAEAPQPVPAPGEAAGSTPDDRPDAPTPNRPAPIPTNEDDNQPAPVPTGEPGDEPAPVPVDEPEEGTEAAIPDDCNVAFYPDLFVSTTLTAGSITAQAQFVANPGETVAFGAPLQLPVELGNAIVTFDGFEHMTGRQVTPQQFDFGPDGLTQPFDVSLDFGGSFDIAQYRIDLTINPVDEQTIEIANVSFTHEHCDLGIRVPIDLDDIVLDEIRG